MVHYSERPHRWTELSNNRVSRERTGLMSSIMSSLTFMLSADHSLCTAYTTAIPCKLNAYMINRMEWPSQNPGSKLATISARAIATRDTPVCLLA
jgi:hypothetical protein